MMCFENLPCMRVQEYASNAESHVALFSTHIRNMEPTISYSL
jgi:hypothetical protein